MRLTPYELSLCVDGERQRLEHAEDVAAWQTAHLLTAWTGKEHTPKQLLNRASTEDTPEEKFVRLLIAQGKSPEEARAAAHVATGKSPSQQLEAALEGQIL